MRGEDLASPGGLPAPRPGSAGVLLASSADSAPLFSLPLGEGAGTLLAAAAGDVAGGADPNGYSAVTQTSVVVAYHLLQLGSVDRDRLAGELAALDRTEDGVRCYRGESDTLRAWLESVRAGEPAAVPGRSAEPASRTPAVGVWFRRDPGGLVEASIGVARLTHLDASSVVAAAAVAGAVAGSCFAQAGSDLVLGAAETAERAVAAIRQEPYRFSEADAAPEVPSRLRSLAPLAAQGIRAIVGAVSEDNGPVGLDGAILGILLGASRLNDPVKLIEAGAMTGGSEVGAIVGAIVGARSGLVRWPWRVPNDTWFAEVGRRLVDHTSEIRDLPVPFAVEERMTLAVRNLPSNENP